MKATIIVILVIIIAASVFLYTKRKSLDLRSLVCPTSAPCPICPPSASCPATTPVIISYAKSLQEVFGKRWSTTVNGQVSFAFYQFDLGTGSSATMTVNKTTVIPGTMTQLPNEMTFIANTSTAKFNSPHRMFVNAAGHVQLECEYDAAGRVIPDRVIELAQIMSCGDW